MTKKKTGEKMTAAEAHDYVAWGYAEDQFAIFEDVDGNRVWVNPEHVSCLVCSGDEQTVIHFARGNALVSMDARSVARALGKILCANRSRY